MRIYTGKGDDGFTSLADGKIISKGSPAINLLSSLDELNSHLGLARASLSDESFKSFILSIQKKTMRISAEIAGVDTGQLYTDRAGYPNNSSAEALEREIDALQALLPSQTDFVIPGDNIVSANLDIARTVCRRAEALGSEMLTAPAKKYLNRLSDYLYVLARYMDFSDKIFNIVASELNKSGKILNLDTAKQVIECVEQKAREVNLNAVIAVAGADGNIIAVHVMDGAYLVSFDVAICKAYTSAALKMSTKDLQPLTKDGAMFQGLEEVCKNKITTIGGGVPLSYGNKVLGGLGVSGGTDEEDIKLAEYGAKVFKGVDDTWR